MRHSRLRKFKSTNQVFLLTVKIGLVCYLTILSATFLTVGTSAQFRDSIISEGMLAFGSWQTEIPDAPKDNGSNLSFIDKGNQNVKACKEVTIKTQLKNKGKAIMERVGTYEVFYTENGNPEKHGIKMTLPIGEGTIEPLPQGESTELTYTVKQPGVYAFKANQTNEDAKKPSVWSNWIIVNCPPSTDTADDVDDGEDATASHKETQNENNGEQESGNLEQDRTESEKGNKDNDLIHKQETKKKEQENEAIKEPTDTTEKVKEDQLEESMREGQKTNLEGESK